MYQVSTLIKFFELIFKLFKLGLHVALHHQWQSNWHKVRILIYFHLFLEFYNIKIQCQNKIPWSFKNFHEIIFNFISSVNKIQSSPSEYIFKIIFQLH